MRGLAVGSVLAATSAEPSAKLSFRRPHRPLGSAAEIAIPAIVTLSRRSFHSSGVKFDLSAIEVTPLDAMHDFHLVGRFLIIRWLKVRQAYQSLISIKPPRSQNPSKRI